MLTVAAGIGLFSYLLGVVNKVSSRRPDAKTQANYANLDKALRLAEGGDMTQAIPLLKEAAKAGIPVAHLTLGDIYRDGRGVAPSDTKAIYHYQQAGLRHPPYAQAHTRLASLYENAGNKAAAYAYYRIALACTESIGNSFSQSTAAAGTKRLWAQMDIADVIQAKEAVVLWMDEARQQAPQQFKANIDPRMLRNFEVKGA